MSKSRKGRKEEEEVRTRKEEDSVQPKIRKRSCNLWKEKDESKS